MDTVKVSGEVSRADHKRLVLTALEHEKTVGALVSFAVSHTLKQLKKNPELIRSLPDDRRRYRGEFTHEKP